VDTFTIRSSSTNKDIHGMRIVLLIARVETVAEAGLSWIVAVSTRIEYLSMLKTELVAVNVKRML